MSGHMRRVSYWPRTLSDSEMQAVTTLAGPTLSLDFHDTLGTLDPRITFTRASTAAYIDASGFIQMAAVNAPRWDYDPVTHQLRGVLIEEQRTNVVYPSTNWNNIPLAPTQDGWIPNAGISPSGANDAMALIPCVTDTVHQFFTGGSYTVNTTYTYSVYLKAAGYPIVGVALANTAFPADQLVMFDLSNGTIRTPDHRTAPGKIQAVGNGPKVSLAP